MKQKPSAAGKTSALLALILGAVSFAAGILNNVFPKAVTPISIVGLLAGLAGLVLAILVRKSSAKDTVILSSIGLVLALIGILWNATFFVVCSVCSVSGL